MQLQQNSLFDNRYMLRTLIGRGGFSEVWLAHDTWTDLDIAIKVYAPGQGMDTNGLQIFSKELACVFNLNHPNLLKPTHVGQWLNMPYLIMEYCPKGALNKQVGKLTEQEIWKVLHDVAAGLAYLHSKEIVHQDIKPDNILRDENGDYRITDFGISTKARTTLRRSVGGTSVSGGTTAYMAPERFSANPAPTKASDVWSLGAMIYELITGDVPFGEIGGGLQKNGAEIPTIEPIIGAISPTLAHVVCQMLAPNAWDRPTAETLATWAANPAVLHFSSVTDTPKTATDRPTTPLSAERDTVIFEQHTQHNTPHTTTPPQKSSKAWIWVLVLLIALIIGIPFGIKIYDDYQWEKTYKTFTANGVSFTMVYVQGGTFTMGATSEQGSDAYDDETPTHHVTLRSYYIGQTEVTQALWQAVMGNNPSYSRGTNKPVENVSYNDCKTFIRELNSLTGQNFRLPTEAEWEFAARGGNRSIGYKYAGSDNLSTVAWYYGNSGNATHPVAQNSPNELGLYDMSGNVWEWCNDWYGGYSSNAQTNPQGPYSGSYRVDRGGSCNYFAGSCRVSYRNYDAPSCSHNNLGLRLAL